MTIEAKPSARAQASRRNGGKSRGPVTTAGRASSARNALKHGLRARTAVLLDDEDAGAFQEFATALRAKLAPEGALRSDLVARIALAAWRARRSDRIEAALFPRYLDADGHRPAAGLGAALIRDGNGPRAIRTRVGRAVLMHRPPPPTARAIETLLRYRGSVLAELFRALGALKALQTGARGQEEPGPAAPRLRPRAIPNERLSCASVA